MQLDLQFDELRQTSRKQLYLLRWQEVLGMAEQCQEALLIILHC